MIAILYSFLSALGWSLFPIFDRKALQLINNNIYTLFLLKIVISGLIGLIMYFLIKDKINLKHKNIMSTASYVFLSVLTGTFLGHFFYVYALSSTNNTSMVITITHITPILLVSILSYLLFKEKFNLWKIIGLLICIIGLSLFIYNTER